MIFGHILFMIFDQYFFSDSNSDIQIRFFGRFNQIIQLDDLPNDARGFYAKFLGAESNRNPPK